MSDLPPEVVPFLRALAPRLRRAYDTCPLHPRALVAVHAERDRDELPAALTELGEGHAVAALPFARVHALAKLVAPSTADRLANTVDDEEVWCLVIGPSGAGVVPIVWDDSRLCSLV